MKTGYLITARLKSTRLPQKLLRNVCGRPILAHMLDRLKLAQRVDQIIICTSTNPEDDKLVALALSEGVDCFRGDEEDVLKRLYDAAVAFDSDYILNITADCPFVDPIYADKIVDAFEATNADLIRALELPHGAYSYGIKPAALETILEIKDDKKTEVWGRFFTDTDLFNVYDLPIDNPLHRQPALRMTLDYPEDLEFFKTIFAHLYRQGQVFSLDHILNFLKEHPEVVEINRHCSELYSRRWTRQSGISLKPRHQARRVAVFGCGSIGQRHIRNLRRLGVTDITALRSRQGHSQELDPGLGVREVETWQELIETQPDVALISNPTSLHLKTATQVMPHVRGLFVEKPLDSSLDGVRAFLERVKANKSISFVGFTLQFHPAVQLVQEYLESDRLGSPLVLQCQVGHWLPDWHPYEDYRQAYYARKDLGGGVALTLIHEIHLSTELLGPARAVSCLLPTSDSLPLEVDAIADMMVEHSSTAVSQIHLDFVQRLPHRCGIVSCERGWISYDLVRPKVVVQLEEDPAPRTVWQDPDCDTNQLYMDEMRTFLRYVREGRMRHEFDAWRATHSLAVVDAAFASFRSGRLSDLPAWVLDLD
ncbi:cytidylyltransferase domain-containing protein [Chloroflexota bacterium]